MTMQYALVGPRTQILVSVPCQAPREAEHFHCLTHHVGFRTRATVQRHIDAGCVLLYLCQTHGPELPYNPRVAAPEARRAPYGMIRGESLQCG